MSPSSMNISGWFIYYILFFSLFIISYKILYLISLYIHRGAVSFLVLPPPPRMIGGEINTKHIIICVILRWRAPNNNNEHSPPYSLLLLALLLLFWEDYLSLYLCVCVSDLVRYVMKCPKQIIIILLFSIYTTISLSNHSSLFRSSFASHLLTSPT